MRSVVAVLAGIGLGACGNGLGPDTPLALSITLESPIVAAGDSVRFTAAAYNPTGETVEVGSFCGSSLDVIVMRPDGEKVSVYTAQLAGAVPTCQSQWFHYAEPGELIELEFRWEAPAERGRYGAYTQVRCRDVPCPRSAPIGFMVR